MAEATNKRITWIQAHSQADYDTEWGNLRESILQTLFTPDAFEHLHNLEDKQFSTFMKLAANILEQPTIQELFESSILYDALSDFDKIFLVNEAVCDALLAYQEPSDLQD